MCIISYLNTGCYDEALYFGFTYSNPGLGKRNETGFFLFQMTAVDNLMLFVILLRVFYLVLLLIFLFLFVLFPLFLLLFRPLSLIQCPVSGIRCSILGK
jgi:hypothetical protein